ncbi:MAG: hypothetical protein ACK46O_03555 [Flavobacteriia bacterium]
MIIKYWKITVVSGLMLAAVAFIFTRFLEYQENRADSLGWVFDDPVFKMLPIKELSFPIFSITYLALIAYLIFYRKREHFLSMLFLTYMFILFFRMITMSILPFREHPDMIFLQDPFLNNLIYPSKIDADLFFSGHTALIVGLFFLTKNWLFLLFSAVLGLFLMVQRVHYSIDILAAYPFAYLSYRSAHYVISNWSLDLK